ncbi:MAG: diacylglycerol kinase family protein [Myxococcota bacterium]|jgi:diacylglycerol kinase family enzyme|nr:diacylglycerol kinase family protein [Myxococcota bacterium]
MSGVSEIRVIVNPHARRNRGRDGEVVEAFRRVVGDQGQVHTCGDAESLQAAMVASRDAGASVLAICGGDGTNGIVIGAAEAAFGAEAIPRIALLRGGTMNTTATGLGAPRGGPLERLRTVVADLRDQRELAVVRRPLLRGGERLGHLFGTGLVVSYLEEYYARGRPHPTPWTAFTTLMSTAGSAAIRGPLIRRMVSRERLEVTIDGELIPTDGYLTVTAGTVPQMGLGFAPFHRCAEDPERFHVLGITVSATAFLRDLFRFRTGRGLLPHHGFSRLAKEVVLRPAEGTEDLGVMMDGDAMRAPAPFTLSLGPTVDVIVGAR